MQPAESTATFGFSEGYDLKKQSYWYRRRWSFRVWQVLLFIFVVVVVIAVLALLMAMYGPGNVNLRYEEAKGTATPGKVTEANDRETTLTATTSKQQKSSQTQATTKKGVPTTTKEPTSITASTTGLKQSTTNASQATTPRSTTNIISSTAKPSTTVPPTTTSGVRSLQCGVAIVGGGTAGLLMKDILLKSKNETSVCLFEKENRLGGRIYDHFFSEAPNVPVGLGFWNVKGEYFGELHLLDHFKIAFEVWSPIIKQVEARGAVEDTYGNRLMAKAFPTLLSRYPTNNESLFRVAQYVGGNDHAPAKNTSQFSTAGTFLSYYLSPEGAEFLEDVYGFNGDYMQAINPDSYRTYLYKINILRHNSDDDSRPAKGMSQLIRKLNPTTQPLGAKVFTGEAVKSINKDGNAFLIKTRNFTVRANKTILAVGPSAIKEMDGYVAKSIVSHKIFQSIVGVPEFEGAAVYAEAWWNDSTAHQKNNSLEPLQMFISNSDCLGITMPYGGGGPNNKHVLHTISSNGECSDKWGNILKMSKTDLDIEVKRALEYKFGREVPSPLATVYKYWDEGVWFLQQPGANFSEVELREWAKRPLAGSSVHLVGGAYNNFGGWLLDTLLSVNEALNEGWNISLPFSLG